MHACNIGVGVLFEPRLRYSFFWSIFYGRGKVITWLIIDHRALKFKGYIDDGMKLLLVITIVIDFFVEVYVETLTRAW